MTADEVIGKVMSKEKEINELLLAAHVMGLEIDISQDKQTTIGKIDNLGQGFRSDLIGYDAPMIRITFMKSVR
jgi:hypothetical protein